MQILYSGWFLKEGFQGAGCDLVTLQLSQERTLNEAIQETGVSPDFVFIELFGPSCIPNEIYQCEYPLILYCIDSSINEFWLKPLAQCFDMVFVDQVSSVQTLQQCGVDVHWLPLCASESDFRQTASKKHFITFVGRTDEQRLKRQNLLDSISERFELNIVEGISKDTMLDLFSESHVVLNENFFPGLNLRFFQALASGSLLLSESKSQGVRKYFQAGTHYVAYSPANIIELLEKIQANPSQFQAIARQGQELCRNQHLSFHRAQSVLQYVQNLSKISKVRKKEHYDELQLYEAIAKYHHGCRFGGNITQSLNILKQTQKTSKQFALAQNLLGSAYITFAGQTEQGSYHLQLSSETDTEYSIISLLQLMYLYADSNTSVYFLEKLFPKIAHCDVSAYNKYVNLILEHKETKYNICLLACKILYDMNRIFDLGYAKSNKDFLPEYAWEYAYRAYETKKSSESLGYVIDCAKKIGMPAETLHFIKDAIGNNIASDEQILLSIHLAHEYYDFSSSRDIVKAFKKALQTGNFKQ